MRSPFLLLLLPLPSLVVLGCGAPTSPVPDSGFAQSQSFIALAGDFEGYTNWPRFDLGYQPGGSVHRGGPRTVFVNRMPPRGSTRFPVGTILVKVVHPEPPPDAGDPGNTDLDAGTPEVADQIFAMAKRGGEFNDAGAAGWEWFELDPSAQIPVLVWRGAVPPPRQAYGGGAGGACNSCHLDAQNDFVLASQLQLGSF